MAGSKQNNTIIFLGLGLGALWLLKDQIKGFFGGVEKVGQGVGDVASGIASPFQYADTFGEQKQENLIARETIYRESLKDPQVQKVIYATTESEEQTKLNRQQTSESMTEKSKVIKTQQTETTISAQQANKAEQTARKTEYGSTVGEYVQKTFMPTKAVAQQRQEALKTTYAKIDKSVGGILPGGSENKVIKGIKKIFKR